jgi:hypothetical protein
MATPFAWLIIATVVRQARVQVVAALWVTLRLLRRVVVIDDFSVDK